MMFGAFKILLAEKLMIASSSFGDEQK